MVPAPYVTVKAVASDARKRQRSSDADGSPLSDRVLSSFISGDFKSLSIEQLASLGCAVSTRMAELQQVKDDDAREELQTATQCAVCMDSPKAEALVPCGHIFCVGCASRCSTCPICKQTATSRVRVFL